MSIMLRYLVAFLFIAHGAAAQAVTQAEVMAGSAKLYREQTEELRRGTALMTMNASARGYRHWRVL